MATEAELHALYLSYFGRPAPTPHSPAVPVGKVLKVALESGEEVTVVKTEEGFTLYRNTLLSDDPRIDLAKITAELAAQGIVHQAMGQFHVPGSKATKLKDPLMPESQARLAAAQAKRARREARRKL